MVQPEIKKMDSRVDVMWENPPLHALLYYVVTVVLCCIVHNPALFYDTLPKLFSVCVCALHDKRSLIPTVSAVKIIKGEKAAERSTQSSEAAWDNPST